MGQYVLESEELALTVRSHGAEMVSLKRRGDGREYLWNGDERYWKRTAPVLFPLVGNYRNKECSYRGRTYRMSQHGFARDMEFSLTEQGEGTIWFRLSETEETLRSYPFPFLLEIGYRLAGRRAEVLWRVTNTGEETMHFSIGGHPAFLCPIREGERQSDYFLRFDREGDLEYSLLNGEGLKAYGGFRLHLDKGVARIAEDMFDKDALLIENGQAHRVSLLLPDRTPYVTVEFDAPVLGLWSPAGKRAPFVCIEPWYGRSDASDFEGTLEEREWGNALAPSETFEASFAITAG